jgi:NADH-quinone oxidoreductase subunit J
VANFLFYLMGAGAVAASVGVVSAKNPIMSVLSLLTSFFCLAVIYLLAGYQFMAAAQLLVYAGAIMVLFLFVIMLLNLGGLTRARWLDKEVLRARRLPLILAICAGVLVLTLVAVGGGPVLAGGAGAAALPPGQGVGSLHELAVLLFGRFLLPFEAASVLLLATAVAVLVLAKRQRGAAADAEGTTAP